MWDVLSGVAEMAWDVLSGAAKMAWGVLSGVTKAAWDVLSRVANLCGMFCPGCQKMAWDVLSRDVLSYIRLRHSSPGYNSVTLVSTLFCSVATFFMSTYTYFTVNIFSVYLHLCPNPLGGCMTVRQNLYVERPTISCKSNWIE